MSIAAVVRHFEGLGRAPVLLRDVVDEFRRIMPNESIRVTGVDISADIMRGAHYSYMHQPSNGSALGPALVTQVIYSTKQPLEFQRLVVCKELIHLFDGTAFETDQPEEVKELIKTLSGEIPKSIKSGNLHWFFDDLAQYQAMAILFPFSLRESILASGKVPDVAVLSDRLELPQHAIRLVLQERWKALRESFLLNS